MKCELAGASDACVDEVLRDRVEIVEDVLLAFLGAGCMPILTELAASAKIHDRERAASSHPGTEDGPETGRDGNVEAAVTPDQDGARAIVGALWCDEKGGHFDVSAGNASPLDPARHRDGTSGTLGGLPSDEAPTFDDGLVAVPGVAEAARREREAVVPFVDVEADDGGPFPNGHVIACSPVRTEQLEPRLRIAHVVGDESGGCHREVFEDVGRMLSDERALLTSGQIHGNDTPIRRVLGRATDEFASPNADGPPLSPTTHEHAKVFIFMATHADRGVAPHPLSAEEHEPVVVRHPVRHDARVVGHPSDASLTRVEVEGTHLACA